MGLKWDNGKVKTYNYIKKAKFAYMNKDLDYQVFVYVRPAWV